MILLRLLLIAVCTGFSVLLFIVFGGFGPGMNALRLLICLFILLLGFLDYGGDQR